MVTMGEEAEIRAAVAARLGWGDVPAPIWRYVDRVHLGRVVEATTGAERRERIEDLAAEAARDMALYEEMRAEDTDAGEGNGDGSGAPPPARPRRRSPTPERVVLDGVLGEYEVERARAFSEAVADMASWARFTNQEARSRVDRFRDDVLGGVLTPEAARDFVLSPGASVVFRAPFEKAAPLPVGLRARVESDEAGLDGDGWVRRVVLRADPPVGRYSAETRTRLATLALPAGDDRVAWVEYWPGSALHELDKLARWLARRFPWREAEAAWFVLTGAAPWVPPVRADYERRRGAAGGAPP